MFLSSERYARIPSRQSLSRKEGDADALLAGEDSRDSSSRRRLSLRDDMMSLVEDETMELKIVWLEHRCDSLEMLHSTNALLFSS